MRGLLVAVMLCGGACKDKGDAGAGRGSGPPVVAPAAPADAGAARERWTATFVVGATLRDLAIAFTRSGSLWTGTLDAGGTTLPLGDVALAADHIAFTIEKPGLPKTAWEHYELQRRDGAGEASGAGTVGGTEIRVRMVRLADGEPARSAYPRPQTPKPPFPYEARELVVSAPDGGKLAGTLTLPPGPGPFPAVVLLSGSGQQDRDETIFGHKPYLIVADRLTREGFAVYRFDDRGTGKTTGAVGTLDTEIADAGAIVDVLATQHEIDPTRIGIIGHSTGGMVAPNVAAAHRVAFVVSLAGPSVSGRELVPLQLAVAARARGASETELHALVELQTKIGAAAIQGEASVRAALTEIVRPQLEKALGRAPTAAEIESAIAKPLADALQPWTLSFFRLDPRVAWRQLAIPILLVVGDRDTQVPADITIKTLQESLAPAAAARLVVAKRAGLNHLFQHARTGAVDEYVELEESFDPATLDLIAGWLGERAKLK